MTASEFLQWAIVFGLYPGGGGGGGITAQQVQQGAFNVSGDTGPDGTAYIGLLTPAPASYTNNLRVLLTPAHTSTINIPTFALNALPAKPIISGGPFLFEAGSIELDTPADLIFSTAEDSWILQNPVAVLQPLDAAKIFVGNPSNIAVEVFMSGDATLNNAGVLTVTGLNGTPLTFGNNQVLATNGSGIPSFTSTLPTAVQSNITRLGTQAQALNMGSFRINNLATPTLATDGVNKAYADSIAGGLNPIPGVYAASTTNLTGYIYNNGTSGVGATLTAPSSGVFTLDGTTPPVGAAVLYKDDTTGSGAFNGIYIVTTSTGGSPAVLTRATYYDSTIEIQPGDWIAIENGTVNVTGSSFIQTSTVTTVGTDPLTFSQFFSPANYLPLAGGTMSGVINMGGHDISNIPAITDPSGNPIFAFTYGGTPVNYLAAAAGGTGGGVGLVASGTDPNIAIAFYAKNGPFFLQDITHTIGATLYFNNASGSHSTSLGVAAGQSTSVDFTLPAVDGSPGYVMQTNGSGVLSFVPNGGGGGVTVAQVQAGDMNLGVDSGVADAYVVTMTPPIASYTDDLVVRFVVTNANLTTIPTVNVDTQGAIGIVLQGGDNVAIADMPLNYIAVCIYSTALNEFILQNPATSLSATFNSVQGKYVNVTDTGIADAYVAVNPFYPASGPGEGQIITVTPLNTNTGACTFAYSGASALAIKLINGSDPAAGDIVAGTNMVLSYSGSPNIYQLLNPAVSGGGGSSPWTAGGIGSAVGGDGSCSVAGSSYSLAYGTGITVSGGYSSSFGRYGGMSGNFSGAFGEGHTVNGDHSFTAGEGNTIGANHGFAFGEACTVNANLGYALGYGSTANNQGSVVWSDSSGGPVNDSALNQWNLTFANGFRLYFDITPTLAAQFLPTGSTIIATNTNDDAPTGYIGEYYESVVLTGAGVSLTTGTPTDITSIPIPSGGDWEAGGNVTFLGAAGTVITELIGWEDTTSATPVNGAYASNQNFNSFALGGSSQGFVIPTRRFSLAAGATLYLSVEANFSVSTLEGSGMLWLRRVR